MNENQPRLHSGNNLRRLAEEKNKTNVSQNREPVSPEESERLLHELQVHQIELEMQNDELRRVQDELEASWARYFDLYDLAPVGYFTVNEQGLILEANLTAASLFGVARNSLIKRPFSRLILSEDTEIYYRIRKQLFETEMPQFCSLRMRRADAPPFWARLEATLARDAHGMPMFRGGVSDITELKQAQEILERERNDLEQRVADRTVRLADANKQLRIEIEDRKQSQEALQGERQVLNNLLRATDQERQTIAYEIHDELAQQLTGAIMQFQTYEVLKDTNPELAMEVYRLGVSLLHKSHSEARRLIAGVRPPILDESGITAAIRHFMNEQRDPNGPELEYYEQAHFNRLAPAIENAIYRIIQEGVANACQHSGGAKVRVSLVQKKNWVRIKIRDWGVGFDVKEIRKNRFGLEGIRQRVRLLGGKCNVLSIASKGTCISVKLPLIEREAGCEEPLGVNADRSVLSVSKDRPIQNSDQKITVPDA